MTARAGITDRNQGVATSRVRPDIDQLNMKLLNAAHHPLIHDVFLFRSGPRDTHAYACNSVLRLVSARGRFPFSTS